MQVHLLEVHALNEELTVGISAFAQVMGGMIEREKDGKEVECQFSEKKKEG